MPASAPHILILDDDPAIREALATAFKGTYVIHGAATGKEACALLRRHPVAAIVLDAVLGDEHGLDLIARFRAISSAPILVLTGYGTEDLAVRALRAKASEYLKKPVNVLELRAALARLTPPPPDPAEDPVDRARRLMTERPDHAQTTGRLARQVGLSDRHFRRRFFEAFGKTPQRYLTEVRMQRAKTLLRTTRLGIAQIAQAVGYASGVTFDRIFKRAYGITPSAFRANRRHLGVRDRKDRGSPIG